MDELFYPVQLFVVVLLNRGQPPFFDFFGFVVCVMAFANLVAYSAMSLARSWPLTIVRAS